MNFGARWYIALIVDLRGHSRGKDLFVFNF
jgi:hypothetical protein